jgi:hypothetical protein
MLALPAVALGVLLIGLGWLSVSGEPAFADQTMGLNLAIAGAALACTGCGLHLWALRRRVARRLLELRAAGEVHA